MYMWDAGLYFRACNTHKISPSVRIILMSSISLSHSHTPHVVYSDSGPESGESVEKDKQFKREAWHWGSLSCSANYTAYICILTLEPQPLFPIGVPSKSRTPWLSCCASNAPCAIICHSRNIPSWSISTKRFNSLFPEWECLYPFAVFVKRNSETLKMW